MEKQEIEKTILVLVAIGYIAIKCLFFIGIVWCAIHFLMKLW